VFGFTQNTIEFKPNLSGDQGTFSGNIVICKDTPPTTPYTFSFEWPMIESLNVLGVTANNISGNTWEVTFDQVWQMNRVNGCQDLYILGDYNTTNGAFYPPYGLDSEGDTLFQTVVDPAYITRSANASPETFQFTADCFLPSPDKLLLGQAQVRAWRWPVDVNVPTNRKGWALAVAHSNRYFNNLLGDNLVDMNYAFAISLIEGRLSTDTGIIPPAGDDWPLNEYNDTYGNLGTMPNPGQGGMFQIKPLGWQQLEDFYPSVFNSMDYSGTVEGANFITSCWSKTFFDYSSIVLLEQHNDFCNDVFDFIYNSSDEYATEEILAYMYNQGAWGFHGQAGNSMFVTDRANYLSQTDIAEYCTTQNGCSEGSAYMERIRNYLMQLGNNMNAPGGSALVCDDTKINWGEEPVDPNQPDYYEFNGFYNEPFSWADIDAYITEAGRVFHQADLANARQRALSSFNAINGGNPVDFQDLGPLVDTLIIAFPAYSGSAAMKTKYEAQTALCSKPAANLISFDTICPGENAELWVTMMGTPPFAYSIEAPDGSIINGTNINVATDYIIVDQPGTYTLLDFYDASGRSLKTICSQRTTTVENAGTSSVMWDLSNETSSGCATRDLGLLGNGTFPFTVTYEANGTSTESHTVNNTSDYYISTTQPGDYYVLTSFNGGGCTSTLQDTITFCDQCTSPQLTLPFSQTTICSGNTTQIELTIVNDDLYDIYYQINGTLESSLQESLSTFSIAAMANSTLVVDSIVSALGCTLVANDTIKVLAIDFQFDIGADTNICAGSMINLGPLSATMNHSYTWSTGASTSSISINNIGQYWLEIDSSGCVYRDSIQISNDTTLQFNIGADTTICPESSISIGLSAPSAGHNYTWNTSATSSTIIIDSSGVYWLEIDSSGCIYRDSITVYNHIPIQPSISGAQSICENTASSAFSVSPLFQSYNWTVPISNAVGLLDQNQVQTATGLIDYTLSVATTDVNGCTGGDTANITVLNSQSISASTNLPDSACTGQLSELSVVNPDNLSFTYEWYLGTEGNGSSGSDLHIGTGDIIHYNLTDGSSTYVQASLTNNTCSLSPAYSTIAETTVLEVPTLATSATSICSGDSILGSNYLSNASVLQLTAEYHWSFNGSTSSADELFPAVAGTYDLTVSNGSSNCSATTSIPVAIDYASITLSSTSGPEVTENEHFTLTAAIVSGDTNTIVWNTGDTGESISTSISQESTFTASITNNSGCFATESITIAVTPPTIEPEELSPMQLFTPGNGDSDNDFWEIRGIESFPQATIEVYNRWGNLVFKTQGTDYVQAPWLGINSNGNLLPVATYYYIIHLNNDALDVLGGNVTIMR
jgi:gliding motility-associated-like protein